MWVEPLSTLSTLTPRPKGLGRENCIERLFGNALFQGIDALGLDLASISMIVHGSTQVLNTILQENGAKIGLITTRGFRDVLELGRGSRPEVYNLFYKPSPPLVPRYLRYEVSERLDVKGQILKPLDETELKAGILALKGAGVEGIAICFLHAYANPVHEERALR